MSLADEYRRQFQWRDWTTAVEGLPQLSGQVVLDLGCGVGDLAAELAARGARVIGLDMNDELLAVARSRRIKDARFERCDLRSLPTFGAPADGIWCSFTAAYFPSLAPVLRSWAARLRRGGWIALTDVEDLLGHEPLLEDTRAILETYATDALAGQRYDFHMGGKLRSHLEEAGFSVTRELTLADRELSFDGPAVPQVIEAWRLRLDRMKVLQEFCGARFERVRDDILGCLAREDHLSRAKVRFCLGHRRELDTRSGQGEP